MMLGHRAGSRFIGQYDVNNLNSTIVDRSHVQLS